METRTCIMIVEDDAALLGLLHDLLRIEGYDVVAVQDAHVAPRVAEMVRPAVVLIDVMLQGTSGLEVAQQLHEIGFVDTPMIAMSASETILGVARSSELFDDYIHKPFDLRVLIQRVKRALYEA